jgi:hypothetical protein
MNLKQIIRRILCCEKDTLSESTTLLAKETTSVLVKEQTNYELSHSIIITPTLPIYDNNDTMNDVSDIPSLESLNNNICFIN